MNYLSEQKRAVIEGTPYATLMGPPRPSVSALLDPTAAPQAHPLIKVLSDIISKFPDLRDIPEKLGSLYIMFLLLRWEVSPTDENYERVPAWMRPTESQLVNPHPAWIDFLPW